MVRKKVNSYPATHGQGEKQSQVLFVIGLLITIGGVLMAPPAIGELIYNHDDWQVFATAGVVSTLTGLAIALATYHGRPSLDLRQAFRLTVGGWLAMAMVGALPFVFSGLGIGYTDAFFETISGLTTTGSTVFTGLDTLPPGILLWRAELQWMGGVGIIVTAIALLPFLRVGGMQLFKTESSDNMDKALPRIGQVGLHIIIIYILMTVLCALSLKLAGMSGFDALTHAMTAVSTGGYSTHDASIGYFNDGLVEWILIVFMIMGSLPFTLYIATLFGRPTEMLRSMQVRAFILFLVIAWFSMALWLNLQSGQPYLKSLTETAFNVTSIVTTTGFASQDYTLWGPLAVATFFALTFVGGCTGSTSGGIKVFRFIVAWKILRAHLQRLISPHAVIINSYEGQRITDDVASSVLLFFFVFVSTVGLLALPLAGMGIDWVTAVSGAATAVANVGPGIGPIIGPAGNFASLPDPAKWLLSAGMLLGRLEFFTVLVLMTPEYWKR